MEKKKLSYVLKNIEKRGLLSIISTIVSSFNKCKADDEKGHLLFLKCDLIYEKISKNKKSDYCNKKRL